MLSCQQPPIWFISTLAYFLNEAHEAFASAPYGARCIGIGSDLVVPDVRIPPDFHRTRIPMKSRSGKVKRLHLFSGQVFGCVRYI